MSVTIIPYHADLTHHFTQINLEWLNQYFEPEKSDIEVLQNPEQHIMNKGGDIYFAQLDDKRIAGAIALKHQGNGVYELSKMGVRPFAQGMGIGQKLILHVVKEFQKRPHKSSGEKMLYLESNDTLRPAIYLYEKHGFHHTPFPSNSPFARANVYMVWQEQASSVHIQPAESLQEIETVKVFFTEYANWLEQETGLSLEFQGFTDEMAQFPQKYRCLLLAYQNKRPIGAVALLHHTETTCEMKRLWVNPSAQRSGAGRALSICIMNRAKYYGYKTMLLDSLRRLKPAVSLYKSLGFTECQPYNHNPEADVIYMKRDL